MDDVISELNELKRRRECLKSQISLERKSREDSDWFESATSTDEYAAILRRTYNRAPRGDKMLALNLFGIKYGQEIRAAKMSVAEIVRRSEIGQFEQEVNGGVKLSPYVVLK